MKMLIVGVSALTILAACGGGSGGGSSSGRSDNGGSSGGSDITPFKSFVELPANGTRRLNGRVLSTTLNDASTIEESQD